MGEFSWYVRAIVSTLGPNQTMVGGRNTSHDETKARRDAQIALGCALAVALLTAMTLLIYIWWT